jgi:hypothetical protein
MKPMENNMTAVEWLIQQIEEKNGKDFSSYYSEFVNQAKAMEKEQIEESFKNGRVPVLFGSFKAEDYYNETYGKD